MSAREIVFKQLRRMTETGESHQMGARWVLEALTAAGYRIVGPGEVDAWRPIETAPKDKPIVGWCSHDADPYHDGDKLTAYAAGCEALGHVPDGTHVLEWTPDEWESTDEYGSGFTIPGWWTRFGSEGEEYANPTHWMPLSPVPSTPAMPNSQDGHTESRDREGGV